MGGDLLLGYEQVAKRIANIRFDYGLRPRRLQIIRNPPASRVPPYNSTQMVCRGLSILQS